MPPRDLLDDHGQERLPAAFAFACAFVAALDPDARGFFPFCSSAFFWALRFVAVVGGAMPKFAFAASLSSS